MFCVVSALRPPLPFVQAITVVKTKKLCPQSLRYTFRTRPRTLFVEIITRENQVLHILISHREQRIWKRYIEINDSFLFTNLKYSKVFIDDDSSSIYVYRTTPQSQCCRIENIITGCLRTENLINYDGKVTAVRVSLGELVLDDKISVCFAFLYECSDITIPSVGQVVSVRNAHLLREEEPILFLCGRSHMDVQEDGESENITPVIPLAVRIMKSNLGFPDYLWLKEQYCIMEHKFNDTFLEKVGIGSEYSSIREVVLYRVSGNIFPDSDACGSKRSVSREFLNHERCSLNHREHFCDNFATVESLIRSSLPTSDTVFWDSTAVHRDIKYPQLPLVVYLSASNGTWMVEDATGSLPCVISSADSCESLNNFADTVVSISKYSLLSEKFHLDEERPDEHFTYIHFCFDDVQILHDLRDRQKAYNIPCSRCEGLGLKNHVCIPLPSDPKKIRTSSVPSCSKDNDYYISVKVIIHHKTPLILKRRNGPRICIFYALVTECSQDTGVDTSKMCFLIFHTPLFPLISFLRTDTLYELRVSPHNRLFNKITYDESIPPVVQIDGSVELPQECCFYEVRRMAVPRDWFSVTDALSCGTEDVINLEGVIIDRLHIVPTFISEKIDWGVRNFGIPGKKTAVLKIRDLNNCMSQVSLYLKGWYQREYPRALLQGAHICAMYVKKQTSKKGPPYFVTTYLTRIEVIDLQGLWSSMSDDWGPANLTSKSVLPSIIVWGSITISDLLCASVLMQCKHCGLMVKNNACSYVGCNSTAQPEVKAVLKFTAEEGFSRMTFNASQDLVRVALRLSQQQWDTLCLIAKKYGELSYVKNKKTCEDEALENLVFSEYCKSVLIGRRVHVRCRKLIAKHNEAIFGQDPPNSEYFYCLEITEPDSCRLLRDGT